MLYMNQLDAILEDEQKISRISFINQPIKDEKDKKDTSQLMNNKKKMQSDDLALDLCTLMCEVMMFQMLFIKEEIK